MTLNNFAAELSAIRSSLPTQKKIVMFKSVQVKPKEGDIIVRPLSVYTNGEWNDRWKNKMFKKTSEGSYMMKATQKVKTSPGMSVVGPTEEGIVCFSDKKPSPNWIYFKIVKISTSGKVLFVEPVNGDVTDLIAIYNKRG